MTCPTGKKEFISREAADAFSADVRQRYPEQMPQYAYACEQCPNWHLSATPPEAYATVRTTWPSVPQAEEESRSGKYADRKEQIGKLYKEGHDFQDIVARTGVPYGSVRYYCIELGLYQPTPRNQQTVTKAPIISLEQLASEEASLQARLLTLQQRRQQLIELTTLKIEMVHSGVVIKKEGNVLQLSFGDARTLVTELIDRLPANRDWLATLFDSLARSEKRPVPEDGTKAA